MRCFIEGQRRRFMMHALLIKNYFGERGVWAGLELTISLSDYKLFGVEMLCVKVTSELIWRGFACQLEQTTLIDK